MVLGQVSCGRNTAEPTEIPKREPTRAEELTEESKASAVRIGTTYIWDGLSPNIAWYGHTIGALLSDALIEQTTRAVHEPGLAESWTVSDDERVWTFEIREGVMFRSGIPCTAEEIAWSMNWMREVGTDSLSHLFATFEGVVALDPTTLQVTTHQPVSSMEYLLSWAWILPESAWGAMIYEDVAEFDDLSATLGTGSYRGVDWVEGEYLTLDAYEEYWRGIPAIVRIVYQQYATEDALVQALLAGEVDVIHSVSRLWRSKT